MYFKNMIWFSDVPVSLAFQHPPEIGKYLNFYQSYPQVDPPLLEGFNNEIELPKYFLSRCQIP